MSEKIEPKDLELWERLVRSHQDFLLASRDFLAEGVNRIPIVKKVLRGNGRNTAIYLLQWLPRNELKQVFNELIFLASSQHGGIEAVRRAILSIEREWLIDNIETATEPYLQEGAGEEYRRFLELFIRIDDKLTLKLARRALTHVDYDTREAGQDFLEKLNEIHK